RTARRCGAKVIKAALMALQPRLDLAQARSAFQLAVQQRDKLALAGQPPHSVIRSMRADQLVEHIPRHMLQQPVKHAIVMPHGIDPPLVSGSFRNVQNRVESMPCALSSKTQPDSRGLDPAIHVLVPDCSELRRGCRARPEK